MSTVTRIVSDTIEPKGDKSIVWRNLNYDPPKWFQWSLNGWVPFCHGNGGSNVPDGTEDGQIPVWDEATQTYIPTLIDPGHDVFPPGSIYNYSTNLAWLEPNTDVSGLTTMEVLNKILFGFNKPAFTSFQLNNYSILEVGGSVPTSKTFSWTTTYPNNVVSNSTIIRNATDNIIIANNVTTISPYTIIGAEITKINNTSVTLRISQTDSKGNIFTRDYILYWKYRVYYGESSLDTLNETNIKSLRMSELNDAVSRNWDFVADPNKYKYIVVPVNMTPFTSFIDPSTGFNVAMDENVYTVNVTNQYNIIQSYRVYRTYYRLGGSITIKTT